MGISSCPAAWPYRNAPGGCGARAPHAGDSVPGVDLLGVAPEPTDPARLRIEAARTCDRLRTMSLVRLAASRPTAAAGRGRRSNWPSCAPTRRPGWLGRPARRLPEVGRPDGRRCAGDLRAGSGRAARSSRRGVRGRGVRHGGGDGWWPSAPVTTVSAGGSPSAGTALIACRPRAGRRPSAASTGGQQRRTDPAVPEAGGVEPVGSEEGLGVGLELGPERVVQAHGPGPGLEWRPRAGTWPGRVTSRVRPT